MQIFYIEVKETLSKTITIAAESSIEAIKLVKKDYQDENIVLGAESHIQTEFNLLSEK